MYLHLCVLKAKLILVFLFCSMCLGFVKAQRHSVVAFTVEDSILSDTYSVIRKIAHSSADSVYKEFESVWNSLNQEQMSLFFGVSQKMFKQSYLPKPHYKDFYLALIYAVKIKSLSADKITNFLSITNRSISEYSKKQVANFFLVSGSFFQKDLIYESKFNSVAVLGGSFSFKYAQSESSSEETVEESGFSVEDTSLNDDAEWDDSESWSDKENWDEDEGWSDEESWDQDERGMGKDLLEEELSANQFIPKNILPTLEGPYIEFEGVELRIASLYDTLTVSKTQGQILLTNNHFIGKEGKTDWSSVGMDKLKVYCTFAEYSFYTPIPKLQAEKVKFHHDELLNEPIEGLYEHYSRRDNRSIQAIYPAFKSYHATGVCDLKNGVRFSGGFTIRGSKISSASFSNTQSVIEVVKKGTRKFIAKSSKPFSLGDSIITNLQSGITIYKTENDSITHPAVSFRYHTTNNRLNITRKKGYYKNIPFNDLYFNVDIYAEYLTWNILEDSIDLGILNAKKKIPFVAQSIDFYSNHIFQKLRGLYNFHPLRFLTHYAKKINKQYFTTEELTQYFMLSRYSKKSYEKGLYDKTYGLLKGAMIYLHALGFVDYNPQKDLIKMTYKGQLYASASKKRRGADYDNLKITSRIDSVANATIHLGRKEMTIRGIRDFTVNDSLNVYIKPEQGVVVMKANRSMDFNGRIVAGKFVIDGRNFILDYKDFKVQMPEVDSLFFIVTDTSEELTDALYSSNNIVNTGGVLYISEPYNKSARIKNAAYPKLDANAGGQIIFDENLLDGSYKDRVYIDIDPFKIDSATINNSTAISLKGSFISSNILPDFEEDIFIKADNQLGFERNAPPEGYPLYVDKGRFYEKIAMGGSGLIGNGKITYLSGSFQSENFIFYPDSVYAQKSNGTISEGAFGNAFYPKVKLKNSRIRWFPYADKMELRSTNESFEMFDNAHHYRGFLYYTPEGITGKGRLNHELFAVQSPLFTFNQDSYTAERSGFKVYSQGFKPSLIFTKQADVKHNLSQQVIEISKYKDADGGIALPFAEYNTSIRKGTWDIEGQLITFSTPTQNELMHFTSTASEENPLTFKSQSATYNLQDYSLNIGGVANIKVANVNIFPGNGKLLIREGGDIEELSNASLELNAENHNFLLKNGNIKILSGEEFTGKAWYDYVNDVLDTSQILFNHFETNKITQAKKNKQDLVKDDLQTYQTIAQAEVSNNTGYIKIIDGIYFRGQVELVDTRKNLKFDGEIRLTLERDMNHWFSYQTNNEDTNIYILIDDQITDIETKEKLQVGLYLDQIEKRLYCALLENQLGWRNNVALFAPKGGLRFDAATNAYIINPLNKEKGESFRGNTLSYNYQKQYITLEGSLPLIPLDNPLYISFSGVGHAYPKKQDFYLNTMMLFQPQMPTKAYSEMSGDFSQDLTNTYEINDNPDTLFIKLAQILSEPLMEEYLAQAQGEYFPPVDYIDTYIGLSEVKLKWSDEYKSFYNTGEIKMSNILGKEIEAKIEGYIEIPKVSENNAINIFLRSASEEWYFLKIEKNKLQALSSNSYFNLLSGLKTVDFEEVYGFVYSFRSNYLLLEDPIDLKEPEELEKQDGKDKESQEEEEVAQELEETEEEEDDGF